MKRPWMPFYVNDYIGDTRHLSTVQHGAYLLLLLSYWARGGLPDNDQQLANITGLPLEEWLVHRRDTEGVFLWGLEAQKVDKELQRTTNKVAKRREAGEKGRDVSALNRKDKLGTQKNQIVSST